ncbi:MAG: glycosyltransferase family 4 protein [bacterium]
MNILIDANTLYQKDCGSKTYTYNILKEFLIFGQINKNNFNKNINNTSNNINKSNYNINIDNDNDNNDNINADIYIDICDISGNIFPLTSVAQLDDIAYKANYKNFLTKFKKSIPQDSFLYPYIKSFYRNIKKGINKINIHSANKKGKIYDIFFTPYQMEIDAGIAKHKFITIHDIYALTQPENYLTKSYTASFKKYLETYLPYFDAIFTVSEFTKNEIAEYFNYPKEKIFVIYNGFDKKNYKKVNKVNNVKIIEGFKEKYKLDKPYLLYAGVIEPRKNILNLLKAYKELKRQAANTNKVLAAACSDADASIGNLDININNDISGDKNGFNRNIVNVNAGGVNVNMEAETGNKPAFDFDFDLILVSSSSALADETFKLIEELKPAVKVFKGVSNEDLNLFYNCADLFVYPSLYEGFGIPPLEAFACETPVIASNATAIPEICGDGAYYFDPHSVESIKKAITTVLSSQSLRSELIQKGLKTAELYSFKNSAQEILDIFKRECSIFCVNLMC